MPNAKILSEKQAVVAELTEKLKSAASGVLVDYKGITVAEDTALRAELRKNDVEYAVVKNTLVRFAINNCGMEALDDVLNGTTSLAISHSDPIAPMRVINKFAKQFNGAKFVIKAGFMDGKILPLDEINAMAELPIAHQVDWPRIGKAYAAMDEAERKAANDGLNAWLRTMRGNYKALCALWAKKDYDAMVKLMEGASDPGPISGDKPGDGQ